MIKKVTSHGRKYNVYNGTYYDVNTTDEMIYMLDRLHNNRERVIFRFGDTKTGKDWGESNDIIGTIGRSTGEVKIPLLIHSRRSSGGGLLLTGNIVKIIKSKGKQTVYKNPAYHMEQQLKDEIKNSNYLNKKFKRLGII